MARGCGNSPFPSTRLNSVLTSVVLLLALAPLAADTTDERRVLLDAALRAYVQPFDRSWDPEAVRVAWVDLNGDRREDAVVYVEDADWCGSGGCTLLVFEAMSETEVAEMGVFRPAAEVSHVRGPVLVSRRRTNQWRDLVVRDVQNRLRALRFTGESYPFSPAEGERLRRRTAGATLFADGR